MNSFYRHTTTATLLILGLYLVLAPFIPMLGTNLYDSKRILQLVCFSLVGFVFLINLFSNPKEVAGQLHISKNVIVLLLVMMTTGLASVFLSDRVEYALLEFLFFFLLIFACTFVLPSSKREHYRLGLAIFLILLTFSSLYLVVFWGNYITSFFDPHTPLWPEKFVPISTNGDQVVRVHFLENDVLYFLHKRFFNHIQTWTIPLLSGLYLYNRYNRTNRSAEYLVFVLLSLWWMLIFASGARGSTIALVTGLVFCSFLFRKYLMKFAKLTIQTVCVGIVSYLFFFLFLPNNSDSLPLLRTTDSGRLNMWERALDLWINNPVFGAGPMHYAQLNEHTNFAGTHNYYLQFLSEWGVVAFVCLAILLSIMLIGIKNNFQINSDDKINNLIYISFSWSWVAGLMHSFVSGVPNTPMSQCWMILIFAWILGHQIRQNGSDYCLISKKYLWISYLTILTIVLYLLIFIIEYPNNISQSTLYPRFWGQGRF